MLKKIMLATVTSVFLLLSVAVHAEPVTMVFSCKLKDGSTKDDAMAINARWLKWARATGGSDEITSSYVTPVIGDLGGFMWVDTYPDIATWGKIVDADSGFDAEFDAISTCSSNRMLRSSTSTSAEPTIAPAACFPTAATSFASRIPKPAHTGRFDMPDTFSRYSVRSAGKPAPPPVIPVIVTA
jgi:hypothetical protein